MNIGETVKTKKTQGNFLKPLILVLAVTSFLMTEAMIIAVCVRGFQFPKMLSGILNVYTVCLVVTVPAVAGLKGVLAVRRRNAELGSDEFSSHVQDQFLYGVIGAYATISLLIEMFSNQ